MWFVLCFVFLSLCFIFFFANKQTNKPKQRKPKTATAYDDPILLLFAMAWIIPEIVWFYLRKYYWFKKGDNEFKNMENLSFVMIY